MDESSIVTERRKQFDPTRCDWNVADIKKIKQTLYGNGKDGVEKTVTRLEIQIKIIMAMLTPILISVILLVIREFWPRGLQ